MSKDTQLPAELEKEIRDMEDILVKDMKTDNDRNIGYYQGFCEGFNTGAIAYAIKLAQAQQEVERLKNELDVAIGANENLQSRMVSWQQQLRGEQKKKEAAYVLLEKVIYRHEGGLLPDRLLYNEIKTFLDGAK